MMNTLGQKTVRAEKRGRLRAIRMRLRLPKL